jgi:hypothetical protein
MSKQESYLNTETKDMVGGMLCQWRYFQFAQISESAAPVCQFLSVILKGLDPFSYFLADYVISGIFTSPFVVFQSSLTIL